MRSLFVISAVCFLFIFGKSQNISGIYNTYYEVTGLNQNQSKLTLDNTNGINVDDSVVVFQMQGAEISVSVIDTINGQVVGYNGAGSWEIAEVCEVNGNDIIFKKKLLNQYDDAGHMQVIKVDVLNNAVITDTLKCKPWDGTTGGIVFIYNTGTLTFNSDISVSGMGFRGGADYQSTLTCTAASVLDDYEYFPGTGEGAEKGEGIANFTNKTCGRGPMANGGGGGNDHNSGGGGGANVVQGGLGGENLDPGAFNCHGYYPGINGRALSTSGERIFMGGGGGAGHSNNDSESQGVNGGAMVIIISDDIAGNNHTIFNYGLTAPNSDGDGAGGGGAGGSVFMKASTFSSALTIDVHGGNGGNMDASIAFNMDRCFGPGGGGAGGMVRYSVGTVPGNHTIIANGGTPGVVQGSTAACNGTSVNATGGGSGVTQLNGIIPRGYICNEYCAGNMNVYLGDDLLLCDEETTELMANVNNVNYLWSTNETTQSITVPSDGEYWVEVDNLFCKDYDTINIYNANSPPYPDEVSFGVCESSVVLDAQTSGLEYLWNTGDTTQTITVSTSGLFYVDMYNEHCGIRAFFHVYNCIVPPNTITPNGDGNNDQWYIDYILDYENNTVEIYNRRGQMVYKKENYANEFDGAGMPDGVYYYKIDLHNGLEPITGTLTIIRQE